MDAQLMIQVFPFVALFAAMLGLLTAMRYTAKMIPISSDDFQRLVAQETNAKVFWFMTMWGSYRYLSSAGGNQICTESKQRLEFPETCELILMKRC